MNGFGAMPGGAIEPVPEEPNEDNEASYDSLIGGNREENDGAPAAGGSAADQRN